MFGYTKLLIYHKLNVHFDQNLHIPRFYFHFYKANLPKNNLTQSQFIIRVNKICKYV